MSARELTRYQQQHTNSCGAVALMCAAAELGVRRMPRLETGGRREARGWNGGSFTVGPLTEDALYWVTSNETMTACTMPDRVVHCARLLGLRCDVHLIPTAYTARLTALHRDVLQRCQGAGIPILRAAPSPETNQRELCVLGTLAVGLHYVMRRPDGGYMDPADGKDYRDYDALDTWNKCYQRTGLSLMLTGSGVSGEDLVRPFAESE